MTDSAPPPPPPPPPPHGSGSSRSGGLPDGNYDIFIVPPHSAGAGFLYLPSLSTQRNSFIAGIAVALAGVGIYVIVSPVLQAWFQTVMAGNAWGVLILVGIVGVAAWMFGKTSGEWTNTSYGANRPDAGQHSSNSWGAGSGTSAPPPPPPPPPPPRQDKPSGSSAQTGWEKAREETKKREEARKRAEEFERKRAEAASAKEDAANVAKAKAEKEKWEQARAREKEQREREARERPKNDKAASTPERESIKERIERLRKAREEKAASSPSASGRASPKKEYVKPTARSAVGTEDQYSYRPYDTPPPKPRAPFQSSASSVSGLSDSSYAPSQTTAQTTPPRTRGPYSTTDPDKIQILAVYLFKNSFPNKAFSSLVVGQQGVSDGLILHIGSEGLFIDDDVRKVPQREWDVKAWTMGSFEDGGLKGGYDLHVVRATIRNAESSKYVFVFDESEGWKVARGLERLRKGSQVRSLASSGMKENEVRNLLGTLGWI